MVVIEGLLRGALCWLLRGVALWCYQLRKRAAVRFKLEERAKTPGPGGEYPRSVHTRNLPWLTVAP